MDRIAQTFAELKKNGRKAFVCYAMAGFPDQAGGRKLAAGMIAAGADLLEIGVPFSDPLADGEVIQHCGEQALKNGASLASALELAAELRRQGAVLPLVLMSYLNPVWHMGLEQFAKRAQAAGVDGAILPDLPPEEADETRRVFERYGLKLILLAAPTSTAARLKKIAAAAAGFVYVVSVTGVTGERKTFDERLQKCVQGLRKLTRLPLVIGFGVSSPENAREAAALADGVVSASALLKPVLEHGEDMATGLDLSAKKTAELIAAVHGLR